MSASDQSITTPTSSPTPESGAAAGSSTGTGAADLGTESTDPQDLRALLDRARERLSFYETFDRIIGENLRRTGEMMAETVALREQAAQAIRERQAVDDALQADRERYRVLIEGALDEVRTAQPVIESMVARLQGALDELSTATTPREATPAPGTQAEPVVEESAAPTAPAASDPPVVPTTESGPVADEPALDPEPETTTAEDAEVIEETRPEEDIPASATPDEGPKTMDVLAHGVPSAEVAIGLQNLLRGLDQVTRVDAREFADGELRLQIACSGTFPEASLTDWLATRNGTVTSRNGKAIELTFS